MASKVVGTCANPWDPPSGLRRATAKSRPGTSRPASVTVRLAGVNRSPLPPDAADGVDVQPSSAGLAKASAREPLVFVTPESEMVRAAPRHASAP